MMDDDDAEDLEQDLLKLRLFPDEPTTRQGSQSQDASGSEDLQGNSDASVAESNRRRSYWAKFWDDWRKDTQKFEDLCNTLLSPDCCSNLQAVQQNVQILAAACKHLLPDMDDESAISMFMKIFEIFIKYDQLQVELPNSFFTVAEGVLKCLMYLPHSQFNELFSKESCCDMILSSIFNFLNNENVAQDTWQHDIALKANSMMVLQRLCVLCKDQENPVLFDKMSKKFDDWLGCVFPFIFFVHSEVRIEALGVVIAMYEAMSEETFFAQPSWEKHKGEFERLYSRALSCLAQEDVPGWSEVWKFLLNLFDRDPNARLNNSLVNKLLEVEEYAFKSAYPEGRMIAFVCWKELVNRFLDPSSDDLLRWVTLLLQPLISTNSKTEFLTHAKFDVLWHILLKLQPEIENVGDHVLPQFLTLCYAPSDDFLMESENDSSPSVPLMRDECSMLVPLLDALAQLLNMDVGEASVNTYVLPCFKEPFVPNPRFFVKYSRLLFLCVSECTVVVGKTIKCKADDERLRIFYIDRIWKNLMYHVKNALVLEDKTVEEKKAVASLMKNMFLFFKFLVNNKLGQICLTPILETVIFGDYGLQLELLYCKLFANSPDCQSDGSPLQCLVILLLSPQMLQDHGNKHGYLNMMDFLIKGGMGQLNKTVNFAKMLLRTLEKSIRGRTPCSKIPMAVEVWLTMFKHTKNVLCAGCYEVLAKDDPTFSWIYRILLVPVKFMNLCENFQVKMMLNAWTYLASLFGHITATRPKSDVFLCEKFSFFLLSDGDLDWDALTFEDLQGIVHMYATLMQLITSMNPLKLRAEYLEKKLKYSVMVLKRILSVFQRLSSPTRVFMDFAEKLMFCIRNVLKKVRGQCKEAYIWSFSPKIVDDIIFLLKLLAAYKRETGAYTRAATSLLKEYGCHFVQVSVEALLPFFHSALSHPQDGIKNLAVALWREKFSHRLSNLGGNPCSLQSVLVECQKIVEQAPTSICMAYKHDTEVSPKVEVQMVPQMNVQPSALTQEFACESSRSMLFEEQNCSLSALGKGVVSNENKVEVAVLDRVNDRDIFPEPMEQSNQVKNSKKATHRPLTRHQIHKMQQHADDIPALYMDLSQDSQWTFGSGDSSQITVPQRFTPICQNYHDKKIDITTKEPEMLLNKKGAMVGLSMDEVIKLGSIERSVMPNIDEQNRMVVIVNHMELGGENSDVNESGNHSAEEPCSDLDNNAAKSHDTSVESLSHHSISQSDQCVPVLNEKVETLPSTSDSIMSENNDPLEALCSIPCDVLSQALQDKPSLVTPEKSSSAESSSSQRRKAFKPKKLDMEFKNRVKRLLLEQSVEKSKLGQNQSVKEMREECAVDPIEESLHILFNDKFENDTADKAMASNDIIDSREALRAILEDTPQHSSNGVNKQQKMTPKRTDRRKRTRADKHKHYFKSSHKKSAKKSVPVKLKGKGTKSGMSSEANAGDHMRECDHESRYDLRSKEKKCLSERSSEHDSGRTIPVSGDQATQKLGKKSLESGMVTPNKLGEDMCSSQYSSSKNCGTNSLPDPSSPENVDRIRGVHFSLHDIPGDSISLSSGEGTRTCVVEGNHSSTFQGECSENKIDNCDDFYCEEMVISDSGTYGEKLSGKECIGLELGQNVNTVPVEKIAASRKGKYKRILDDSRIDDDFEVPKKKLKIDKDQVFCDINNTTIEEELPCSSVSTRLRSSFKPPNPCLSLDGSSLAEEVTNNVKNVQTCMSKTSQKKFSSQCTSQQPMPKNIDQLCGNVNASSEAGHKVRESANSTNANISSFQSETNFAGNLSSSQENNVANDFCFTKDDTVSREHSLEKIEMMRQLALIPQVCESNTAGNGDPQSSKILNSDSSEMVDLELDVPISLHDRLLQAGNDSGMIVDDSEKNTVLCTYKETHSNRGNLSEVSPGQTLDLVEPGPSFQRAYGETTLISTGDSPDCTEGIDDLDSDLSCSPASPSRTPDFQIQDVVYALHDDDFQTIEWTPLKWNPYAQPLKPVLKKGNRRSNYPRGHQVQIRRENFTHFLTYHRLPEEPIGNTARVSDYNIPNEERFPVRFTRGMAKLQERIKQENAYLTQWLYDNWKSLPLQSREAICENRKGIRASDSAYSPGNEERIVEVVEINEDDEEVEEGDDDEIVIIEHDDCESIDDQCQITSSFPSNDSVDLSSIKHETFTQATPSICDTNGPTIKTELISEDLDQLNGSPLQMPLKRELMDQDTPGDHEVSGTLMCVLNDSGMHSLKEEVVEQEHLERDPLNSSSNNFLTDSAVQTSREAETPMDVVEKADAASQVSIGKETLVQAIAAATCFLCNVSVQTSYLASDMSVQTFHHTNDVSIQTSICSFDAHVQTTKCLLTDASIQTPKVILTDTEAQATVPMTDVSVQASYSVTDTAMETMTCLHEDVGVQTSVEESQVDVESIILKEETCGFVQTLTEDELTGMEASEETCEFVQTLTEDELTGIETSEETLGFVQTSTEDELTGMVSEKNLGFVQTSMEEEEPTGMETSEETLGFVQTSSENELTGMGSEKNLGFVQTSMEEELTGMETSEETIGFMQASMEDEVSEMETLGETMVVIHVKEPHCKDSDMFCDAQQVQCSFEEPPPEASLCNLSSEELSGEGFQNPTEESSFLGVSGEQDPENQIYPPLSSCDDFATLLIQDLTEPSRAVCLARQMVTLGIATVGDFCSKSPSVISQLTLKEPKLSTALAVLKKYESNMSHAEVEHRVDTENRIGLEPEKGPEGSGNTGRLPVITRVESLKNLAPTYAALISYGEALKFWKENEAHSQCSDSSTEVGLSHAATSHSQITQGLVEETHCDMMSSDEPIFPALTDCSDDLDNIIEDLTDSIWAKPLIEKLHDCGIFTVGSLCEKSAAFIQQLPIKEPKLSVILAVLQNYFSSRFEMETKVIDQSDEDVIPPSQDSLESVTLILDDLMKRIPANQIIQAMLASPSRMDCVSEVVHSVGNVEKVTRFLVDLKVPEVLNEYWKSVSGPLQESFSQDVVEFVTKRVLASARPDPGTSTEQPCSSSSAIKPPLTIRSRQSLQAMVKKHGWVAVCRLIPENELKHFLSGISFDTLRELIPTSVLFNYIQREINSDKEFSKQIIQRALNDFTPPNESVTATASVWKSVHRNSCINEELYKQVKEFALKPETLHFFTQMTDLLSLLKPIHNESRESQSNSQSILPEGLLQNLLKIVVDQMHPKDFFNACSKTMENR